MRRLIIEEPLARSAVWSQRCAVFGVLTAGVAVGVARVGGERDPSSALAVFGAALVLAMVALLLAGAAAIVIWRTGRRGGAQAGVGFLLALALIGYPAYLTYRAIVLPPINQASTDFENPPLFMITSRAREARHGRNPPLPDAALAAAQKASYPGLQSMMVDLEPDQAYRMALRICKDLGWRVVDSSPSNLRGDGVAHIDAIDRSLFFGLPDDITIRVKPLTNQTKIDIRAVSRFGKHDFGANARRISRFIAAVQDSVQAR
jgi:uncharacterized protein (DUF1499 family)